MQLDLNALAYLEKTNIGLISTKDYSLSESTNKKYHAFISYRHSDNSEQGRQWATWLHQAIETYVIPSDLVGKLNGRGEKIPSSIYPIFRDEEELPADADLGNAIVKALDETRILIVLCSPRAVDSTYVADEIDYFKQLGHSNKIIAAMIDGEPNTSWDLTKHKDGFNIEDECFPVPLQFEYNDQGIKTEKRTETIAADFRITNNGVTEQGWTSIEAYRIYLKSNTDFSRKIIQEKVNAYQKQQQLMLLKIIAGIIGIPLGELTQRNKDHQLALERKKARTLKQWLAGVFVLAILAIGASVFAYIKQLQASEQLLQSNHNFGLRMVSKVKEAYDEKQYEKSDFILSKALIKIKHGKERNEIISKYTQASNRPGVAWLSNNIGEKQTTYFDMAFSPDGLTLATASKNKVIDLRSVITGKLLTSLKGHSGIVTAVDFSPDGLTLASSSADKSIRLWDLKSGDNIATLIGHSSTVLDVKFSPDGKTIASASTDTNVGLWDVEKVKLKRFLKLHSMPVISIDFSPDGKTLASIDFRKFRVLWDLKNGIETEADSFSTESEEFINPAFSPDGTSIATPDGNKIKVSNLSTKDKFELTNYQGHTDYITSIDYSPNGRSLVSSSLDGSIILWDLENREILHKLKGHYSEVIQVIFSPDGLSLASRSNDQRIGLWDIASGERIKLLSGQSEDTRNAVAGVSYSPDGSIFATASRDKTISIWDALSGELLTILKGHSKYVVRVKFSPDGLTLASASEDKSIILWDVENGKSKAVLNGHTEHLTDIAFSPDGLLLASSSGDRNIILWDLLKDNSTTLTGHTDSVTSVVFSPDGETLASGSRDKSITFWEVSTGKLKSTFNSQNGDVYKLAYSPDGLTLASALTNNTIELWDVIKAEVRLSFTGHDIGIFDIVFSPDSLILASASIDGSIGLWDVTKGGRIRTVKGLIANAFQGVVFSPNRKSLVAGGTNGSILLDFSHFSDVDNIDYLTELTERQEKLFGYNFDETEFKFKNELPQITDNEAYPKPKWSNNHPYKWLQKATGGDRESMFKLGIVYHRYSDYKRAKYWYTKALNAGSEKAKERLDVLNKTIK